MTDDLPEIDLPDEWVVVNCSVCGVLLSGRAMRPRIVTDGGHVNPNYPPVVTGSVKGRPVCGPCLAPNRARRSARSAVADDAPPSWDDVVRASEEVGE